MSIFSPIAEEILAVFAQKPREPAGIA
jgi:hypothetical protein